MEMMEYLKEKGGYAGVTEDGCRVNIKASVEAKAKLLGLLAKMEGYRGNGRVILPIELDQDIDYWAINNCVNNFLLNTNARKKIVKKTNDEGKTVDKVYREKIADLPAVYKLDELQGKGMISTSVWDDFDDEGNLRKSVSRFDDLSEILSIFRNTTIVTENMATYIAGCYPEMKPVPVAGMKISKLFNRIMTMHGIDKPTSCDQCKHKLNCNKKCEDGGLDCSYDYYFSRYSDLVSTKKRKLWLVISVNIVDFLGMSIADNWTSCHNIKERGGWHAGTLSYANDDCTLIAYVVRENANLDEVELESKLYRGIFHYKNGALIQPRIYPSGNDRRTDLYDFFRHIMQKKIDEATGETEDKWVKASSSSKAYDYAKDGDGHLNYEDWNKQSTVRFSYKKNAEVVDKMSIGAPAYCVRCGKQLDTTRSLYCYDCRSEGWR